MRSSMARMIVVISFVCCWEWYLSICLAAEPQERVTMMRPYALNTDIVITLERGQTVQLDFAANPYGLEKYVLSYFEQGGTEIIGGDGYVADGQHTSGGSRIDLDGALRQIGHTPCLAIAKWNVREGKVHIDFCVSDNLERNHREYRQYSAGNKNMSLQYGDRQLIPAIELPETERLAGFVQLWSEAKFNFVFWQRVPDVDWDAVLLEYLPKVQQAKTDVEYYRVLKRCIALLRDGHTRVSGPSDEPRCRPPVEIAAVEGKAVIVQVYPAEQIAQSALKAELLAARLTRGDEITYIDGRAIERILAEDLYPYIAASTPQQKELDAYPRLANSASATKAVLRVRDLEGNEREVSLTRGYYSFPREEKPFLRDLPGGIVLVSLDSFGSDGIVKRFEDAFDKILAAKGLILDLRDNGGGSSSIGYAILKKLVDKPVAGSHWKTRQYMPAFRAWGRKEQWYEGDHDTIRPDEGPRYAGPVVVLTGPATASAAEDFVVAFQTSGRGKVVGRRTLGSTGQPITIKLPGGGGARICTKWDTYPDGREFVGVGCIPDVEVVPTRADIAAGRDVVLEKAVAVLGTASSQPAIREPPELPYRDIEGALKLVHDAQKRIVVERPYEVGTREELTLTLGQAAHLSFKDNPARIGEFLFIYDGNFVHVFYRGVNEKEEEYNSTYLHADRLSDVRTISGADAAMYLKCSTDWQCKDGRALVRFRTELPSQSEQEGFRKERERLRAYEEQAKVIRQQAASVREWDSGENVAPFTMLMDDPNDLNMVELRTQYKLAEVIRGAADEYERLRLLLAWTQKRWKHNGNNTPSRSDPLTILKEASEGKEFRCVEYSIVLAACARSLGMPSRTLGLKRPDVEIAESGAGHVAAEVWLKQFGKWVFVDGQWGATAEKDGIPLNAVEFQDAVARTLPGLKIRLVSKGSEEGYLNWILPYLYYLDFNPGHLFYPNASQRQAPTVPKIMLVPKGAAKPKVFQRRNPIGNCTYISNPEAFYPEMSQ